MLLRLDVLAREEQHVVACRKEGRKKERGEDMVCVCVSLFSTRTTTKQAPHAEKQNKTIIKTTKE